MVMSLRTRDLQTAIRRRPAALAAFKETYASAGKNGHASAMQWRNVRKQVLADPAATERDISVLDWCTGEAASQMDPLAAKEFTCTAYGLATPLQPFIADWLADADIEVRSKSDHAHAVNELLAWAKASGREALIEAFDRKVAGAYVTALLGRGLDRGKTVSKRLWSLSAFWKFLIRKGYTEANPWLGHGVGRGGRSGRDKVPERPFTPAEVQALLEAPAGPMMADLMRVALFSGARLEELALLRVADINTEDRTMALHADPKSQASRRTVPVHSAVWPIVQARVAGKDARAFVLHEMGPEPGEGSPRSAATSKAFRRHREAAGVDDRRPGQRRSLVNFHSFRRTFVTLAEQAGQPETTIRSVVGHKRAGMTFGTYSGGPSLAQLRACVEAVQIPNTQETLP